MVTRFSSRAARAAIIGLMAGASIERTNGARSETCIAEHSAIDLPLTLLASAAALSRAPPQAGQVARVKILSYSTRTCGCRFSGSFEPSPFFSLATTPS